MTTPYHNDKIKYKYSDDEINSINDAWNLLDNFKRMELTLFEYRKRIIKYVQMNYDLEKFLKIESIIEKIYWNMKSIIDEEFNLNLNNESQIIKCKNIEEAKERAYGLYHFRRSYINKIILIDDIDNSVYINKAFLLNTEEHRLVDRIISNRSAYETFMIDNKKGLELAQSLDRVYDTTYAFPNLNSSLYNIGSLELKRRRIKKLFYSDEEGEYWFKLIT